MLPMHKIKRINELSKKSKTVGLTKEEATEQSLLRKEYLETFRTSMRNTVEGLTIIDPEGKDVTPEKIKKLRNNKLH
ncbi:MULTISPECIES: DUF896 domain-containing protein [unclassified Bacillus (in: firmicutes)]|uniref:DUF896 domain-containing protein n=1 Tax=unclassified Bacillus (in: firmicutes) TaxID=185979 RepID=UPI00080ADF51|nr:MULTISPECIES: DUF896 domain-containing protein [unclassified Bacillus (in: firmicutes)]OCA86904.1 hypothetical protein A8L44_06405 [Bacillus sp. FJAT-27986]